MAKKVLVISTSLRHQSNSEILADSFIEGAQSAGNSVEKISLRDKEIAFCKGCLACQQLQKCVIEDDAQTIAEKMKLAEVIVFATPIYYYEMSGQLKTFLDRMNPLYGRDNRFREVYLLASAADTEASAMDGAAKGVQGWIDCFDGVVLKGVVRGTGAEKAGDIRATNAVKAAYEMGKAV